MKPSALRSLVLLLVFALAACSSAPAATPASTGAPAASGTPAATIAPTSASTQAPAVSPSAAAGEPSVLTLTRIDNWVDGFHPGQRNSGNQNQVMSLLYNTLVKVDTDSKTLIPDLAERWEASDDARVYTFHLAQNVTWHDGTPFTAEDVAFTAAWNAQNPAAYIVTTRWMAVEGAAAVKDTTNVPTGIEVIDPHTIRFTLAAPNAEFLRELVNLEHAITPKHILTGLNAEQMKTSPFATTSPVGTGPFKFVRYETGQYVEFEANDDYFKGRPRIDRIFFRFLDGAQALAQLESGELDLAFKIALTEYDRLSRNESLVVEKSPFVGMYRWVPRMDTREDLTDKRVRQALMYGIDRRGIADAVYGGSARILHAIPPGFRDYEDLDTYPYDPDKAKQLLDEAGFDYSRPLRMIYDQTAPQLSTIMPIMQAQLAEIGVNLELLPFETTAWVAKLQGYAEGDWDITMSTGGAEAISPARSEFYFDRCDGTPDRWWTGKYVNCDMIDLFDQALRVIDPAERDALYHQIALILNDEVALGNMFAPEVVAAYSKRLQGFELYFDDRENLLQVEKWSLAPGS